MGRMVRSFVQSLVKLVNSLMAMVGIAFILYSLWMFRVWHKHTPDFQFPWFIYTFLGVGVTLCLVTCLGHIAAEMANGCCLYLYMMLVFLLLMLEAAVTVDLFLNSDWKEDFPEDQTGKIDELEDFIKDNFDMCRLIGLSVVSVQGLCLLLSMILKALGPHRETCYDSDEDDYTPGRVPLLKNYVHHQRNPYVVDDPLSTKNDSWNVRINSKTNR